MIGRCGSIGRCGNIGMIGRCGRGVGCGTVTLLLLGEDSPCLRDGRPLSFACV